jgi:hypothetical protein
MLLISRTTAGDCSAVSLLRGATIRDDGWAQLGSLLVAVPNGDSSNALSFSSQHDARDILCAPSLTR